MDLHTSASLYPAISDKDLLALPFPIIPAKAGNTIVAAVCAAHIARQRASVARRHPAHRGNRPR